MDPASIAISKLIKHTDLNTPGAIQNGSLKEHENITYLEGDACYISLPDKSVDAVSAFDVFEHILPDDVDGAIKECVRVAKSYLLLSIAMIPSKDYEDKNNHPTVEDVDWWIDKLKPYCKEYPTLNNILGNNSYYTLFRNQCNIAIFCVLK